MPHKGKYTDEQINLLESHFRHTSHPSKKQIKEISNEAELSFIQVKFWFQNRRNKTRVCSTKAAVFKAKDAVASRHARLQRLNELLQEEAKELAKNQLLPQLRVSLAKVVTKLVVACKMHEVHGQNDLNVSKAQSPLQTDSSPEDVKSENLAGEKRHVERETLAEIEQLVMHTSECSANVNSELISEEQDLDQSSLRAPALVIQSAPNDPPGGVSSLPRSATRVGSLKTQAQGEDAPQASCRLRRAAPVPVGSLSSRPALRAQPEIMLNRPMTRGVSFQFCMSSAVAEDALLSALTVASSAQFFQK